MSSLDNVEINGVTYNVIITYKRIKNIHFRFKDGAFYISCNRFVSNRVIKDYLEKHGHKLIKKDTKVSAIDENGVYVFGFKEQITFESKKELENSLKDILLEYLTIRVPYYCELMGIKKTYKIKIRNNNCTLGSNSRATDTFSFSLKLIHFSKEIIDSVIVHECAHCFVFNHSKDFYDVVYRYCPNYNLYRKKIIRSIFK